MDYEQKYIKALNRAKERKDKSRNLELLNFVDELFPELKESEDELTWLKNYISEEAYSLSMDIRGNEDRIKLKKLQKSLAWLEKQGEQKPIDYDDEEIRKQKSIDKIEPKFHKGDWIISKYMHLVMQILNNDNGSYKTVETDGTERNDSYDFIERNFDLWNITDAMPGDIIYAESRDDTLYFICIFSKLENEKSWIYCNVYCDSDYSGNDLKQWDFDEYNGFINLYNYNFYPATKEQRHLLYQKMKKAGYEWDSEKKKLIKIEKV